MSIMEPHSKSQKTIHTIDELLSLQQFALEHIQEAVFLIDSDARITYVNKAASTSLGYSKEELLRLSVFDLDPLFPSDIWHEHWRELKDCKNLLFETEHKRIDGIIVPVEVNANYFEYNGVGYNMALARDITERNCKEALLRDNEQKFLKAFMNSPVALAINDVETSRYLDVNDSFLKHLGYEREEVINRNAFEGLNIWNDLADRAIFFTTLQKNGVIQDFDFCYKRKDGSTGYASVSATMVNINGRACIVSQNNEITERKMMEQTLADREREFRALAENIPDNIARWDTEGRYLYINPVHERTLGKSASEVIGTFIPDSHEAVKSAILQAAATGKKTTVAQTAILKDGSMVYHEVSIAPERDSSGKIISVLGIGRDITEQKQMETALKARELEFRSLAENSPNIIIRYDLDCRRLYVNPAFSKHTGIPLELAINAKPDTQWDSYVNMVTMTASEYQKKIQAVMRNGESANFLTELYRYIDGGYKAHDVHIIAEYDTNGKIIGALVIGHDVTEQKQIQEKLAMKERAFRTIAEHTPDTIARYDAQCIRTYVNQAFIRLSGKSAEALLGKKPTDYYCTPQTVSYEKAILRAFKSDREEEIEYTWPDSSGRMLTSLIHIVPEKDMCGKVQTVLATGRNITKQKEIEAQLIEQNRFLESLLNAIPVPIFMKDKETRYKGFNKAFEEFYGKNKEELIGKGVFDIFPHAQAQIFFDADADLFRSGGTQIYEAKLQDARGVDHTVMFHKAVYCDEAGEAIGQIGTILDITERKRVEQKIEHMAHHDALTGLANRTLAKIRAEQIMDYAKRSNAKAAFLFIDLDGFKAINDTLGHSVGDSMLQSVATRLKACIRESDTISRQGGDEFLLILSGVQEADVITSIAQKVLTEMEKSFEIDFHTLSLSSSIGIALYPDHGETFEALLQSADTAMYKAKESGKNGYHFYTQQMSHNLIGQFKIQSDLKSALANNEFILYYQPQIDLATNCIIGAEALIRWHHPQLGMMPPMSFISIAENSGIIVQIGQWVIEESCRQVALWQDMGIELCVAVNISAMQFKRGNLEEIVINALSTSKIDPKYLELELTESIIMHDADNTLQSVRNLKELGVQLSIDDFGTGYSSLSYLKRFAVDKLKIDQSFVRDILHDKDDAAIVKTIIQMAKNLNLTTIAEGVENQEVLSIIEDFGCDEVQGYHFAKPMPAHDFELYHTSFYGKKS